MRVSQVTGQTVRDYLRVAEDEPLLEAIRGAALHYIRSYTGLTDEQMEQHEDLSVALLVLCAEMYDNRQMTVQDERINPVISQILASHSVNLL